MSLVVCVGGKFGVGFSNTTYIGKVGIDYPFLLLLEVYLLIVVFLRGKSLSEKYMCFLFLTLLIISCLPLHDHGVFGGNYLCTVTLIVMSGGC